MGKLNYDHAPALGVPTASPTTVGNQVASTEFVQNVLPPGVVQPYAGPIPPEGWLLCDGSAVSRTLYPRLFAAIGTTYGAGNGTTTFNLPELRGEIIRGLDNGRGVDVGRALGTEQAGAIQTHTHPLPTVGTNLTNPGTLVFKDHLPDILEASSTTNGGFATPSGEVRVLAVGSNETRMRNVALNFIIKAQ